MLTWFLIGYLIVSLLTFLVFYSGIVAAARADGVQEELLVTPVRSRRSTTLSTTPISTETLALSTIG